ncbi:MAG: heavy-metal-associated domain-containing protein [Chloroflexota bacterium]
MESGTLERVHFSGKGGKAADIESNLSGVEGVRSVTVASEGDAVDVSYDSTTVDVNAIRRSLSEQGFKIDSDS